VGHMNERERRAHKPMTSAEREQIREVQRGTLEADRRAKARGLTPADIDREVEDDDSQYWDDFREVVQGWRQRHGVH
jgi:hypothetical protein